MRAGEHGPLLDAIGPLFWIEISNEQWHRTQKIGLRAIDLDLNAYFRANPRLTPIRLSLSQIRSKTVPYPVLE
eukprot:8510154-Pyramimonas_sp.AAC.1